MEYNLIINQAALRNWAGKINLQDAAIIGFIRGLSPDDPAVARHMQGGYYRLHLSWMLREMPLLKIKVDWLSRRLKYLKNLGLLDIISTVDERHQYRLYGKLSRLYFQEETGARASLDGARSEKTPMGENSELVENSHGENSELVENSRGSLDQTPTVKTPIDHKKYDHKDGDGADPLGGSATATEEKESAAASTGFESWLRSRAAAKSRTPDLPGIAADASGAVPAPTETNQPSGETKGPSP